MSKLILPISAAMRNPSTERQAIILRLRELGAIVAGADLPKENYYYIETAQLRDFLQKEEHLAAAEAAKKPKLVGPRMVPDPEASKEVLHWMRQDRKHKEEGTKEYY